MAKQFYITTAISYPNGAPHIGHAYELIACDVLARFKRLDGFRVYFLTGTDEHGQKMLQTARQQNIAVEKLAEKNAAVFAKMGELFNSSVDDFIRTSQERHHKASQAIWQKMLASGDIYKGLYKGWYSMRDEAYYNEDETTVDEKGTRLGKQGTPVEWIEEESYFFRLSKYGERLLKFYNENPNFISPPHRANEAIQFIKQGLDDLSISRNTFNWGVKVPGDESHVMYVWVDALTNYLTALGYPDTNDTKWKFWPADLHVIGKDIMRFHTVFWPAFLMSAGLEIPKRVFGHGFLFNKSKKMSKSIGNVICPFEIAGEYGVDAIRYFLLREVPFGQDGSYSHDAIVGRINADLANDLGNLAQRSLSMIFKNCEGKLEAEKIQLEKVDETILKQTDELLEKVRAEIDVQNLHIALFTIWQSIADVNRYFTEQAPWSHREENPKRMQTILYVAIECLRKFSLLLQPFMPESAEKLLNMLQVEKSKRTFSFFTEPLEKIKMPEPPTVIFPRYVNEGDE